MKLTLAIALALTSASAAFAQETTVRYADLDLSSVAGQAELERRIESATRQICRGEAITGTRIVDQDEVARCKSDVRAQISAQLPR
jgi:UrcA family protein